MGKSISWWQCRKRAMGGINRLREPCGHTLWGPWKILARFLTDLCSGTFANLHSSFMASPVVTFHGQSSHVPHLHRRKSRPRQVKRWDQPLGHLADLYSRAVVLQTKQRKKKKQPSPFLSEPWWFLTFSSSFWAEGDVTQLKTETLNAQ